MISVIILTCNSREFIAQCLDSLFAQEGLCDSEVIVVDNGSFDATAEFIRNRYPAVKLIRNKSNLGACRARNQGIILAKGEWILSLDSDVVLAEGFFKAARQALASLGKERIGLIQTKILLPDKKTVYSCGIQLTKFRRFHDIARGKPDTPAINAIKDIFGACSAAAFYRRGMLEELKDEWGYFDERFFFLVEDVDLSWRAKRKKWQTLFLPQAACYHAGNSAKINKQFRQYLSLRNRCYSIVKNEGVLRYGAKILPFLLYDLPRLVYLAAVNPYARNWMLRAGKGLL